MNPDEPLMTIFDSKTGLLNTGGDSELLKILIQTAAEEIPDLLVELTAALAANDGGRRVLLMGRSRRPRAGAAARSSSSSRTNSWCSASTPRRRPETSPPGGRPESPPSAGGGNASAGRARVLAAAAALSKVDRSRPVYCAGVLRRERGREEMREPCSKLRASQVEALVRTQRRRRRRGRVRPSAGGGGGMLGDGGGEALGPVFRVVPLIDELSFAGPSWNDGARTRSRHDRASRGHVACEGDV